MIENLYRLGKALQSDSALADYFSPWQNPFPTGDSDTMKVIYFPIVRGIVQNYELEAFKSSSLKEYLYRKPAGANGAPLVPTMPFYPAETEEKHLENLYKMMSRLKRAFQNNMSLYFENEADFENAVSEIERQLASFTGSSKNRYLLTVKVDGKWLGQFEENISLFYEDAYNKYYEKSSAKDKLCSITYEHGEVWGRVDTLGFTVNDPTFSRSGFDDSFSYRMFPVSPEAVRLLEGAREYAFERLRRRYSSLEYIIVPHFLQDSYEMLRYAVGKIAKNDQEKSIDDFSKSIFYNEKIVHELSEIDEKLKEGVFYDLLFYQKNQAQLALKLHLTDLMPSRFATIFKIKQAVEKKYQAINRIENSKGEVTDFYITFYKIQRYFSQVIRKETIFHPFFFKLMEAVFYGQQIDERAIMNAFMKKIGEDFKQRNESSLAYIFSMKEAFALWHFFASLGLFTNKQHIMLDSTPSPRTYEEFVAAHADFFDDPYKKAAFNMGCLVSVLTSAQYQKLKSEPFLERLNSLSLDDTELRKLFPVLIDKMRQYEDIDKYQYQYVQMLKVAIAEALMNSTDLDRTNISFSFTAGIVMQKEFSKFRREASNQVKEAESSIPQDNVDN